MSSPTGRAGMPTASTDFIAAIPKAELHLHIEGTLGPALRVALARRNGLPIPDVDPAADTQGYDYASLEEFLDIYYRGMDVLRTERDFYDLDRNLPAALPGRDHRSMWSFPSIRSPISPAAWRPKRSWPASSRRSTRRSAIGASPPTSSCASTATGRWTRPGPCSTSCGRGATGSSASGWIRPSGATRRASSPPCSSGRAPKATA